MLIAQIVFDGFTDLDVFLAWDLLHRVRRPDWTVKLLGTASHHTSLAGLTIPTHGALEEAAQADAVLFASGPATRELRLDRDYLARLRLDPARQLVGSMCSGSLLLAALGLLDGKRATTYPTAVQLLRDAGVTVVDEPFVREGNVATAAACLAGVDLAAWVIESLLGPEARDAALAGVRPVGSAPAGLAEVGNASAAPADAAKPHAPELHAGSCLCGAIRYEVSGELGDFGYCHCTSCRKSSGTAHGSNVGVERARVRFLGGTETLREYESSPGKRRVFCSTCGSPLYAYLTKTPELIRLRLGSLDTPYAGKARAHTFVSEKAPWHRITDALPQFSQWASKSVLVQRGSRQG